MPTRPPSPPSAEDLRAVLVRALEKVPAWRNRIPLHEWEDLVQNAIVRVLEHDGAIAPESCEAWLRRALHHEVLHSLRDAARRRKHAPALQAHLRDAGSPFPPPDAASTSRELLEAVSWLLSQVEPDRREAASQCIRRALGDDAIGLDAIAVELDLERGTLGSQWARSKTDMAAAVRREHARPRGRSKLAALFGTLAALWVWLLDRGRCATAVLVAPSAARRPSDASGRDRGRLLLVAAAGGLLCVTVLSLSAPRRVHPDAGSWNAGGSAGDGREVPEPVLGGEGPRAASSPAALCAGGLKRLEDKWADRRCLLSGIRSR
jgi:DNA-directed RNA polymerase specialized sigma24 family protein